MNALELSFRDKLLTDINAAVLANNDNSVLDILRDMLARLRSASRPVRSASDFYGVWSDDTTSADELNQIIKSSRKFKNDIEALYE